VLTQEDEPHSEEENLPAMRARAVLLVTEHADLVEPDPSQPRLVRASPGLAAVDTWP